VEVLGVFQRAEASGLEELSDLADLVRSGNSDDGYEVEVAIGGNEGFVTLPAGDKIAPVAVERVGGQWLVADTAVLLFGVGR